MSIGCHQHYEHSHGDVEGSVADRRFRRILWFAVVSNAAMFVVEIVAGVAADSVALTADALDFFGDSVTYTISLFVAGMALVWRARAALFKAGLMAAYGVGVLGYGIYNAVTHPVPEAAVMGVIGFLALVTNVVVAVMLYAYRTGDANMRSIWLCSRNDAIGNVAVLLAAAGVFGTGTVWPDLIVGTLMAGLGLFAAAQIVRQARGELRHVAQAAE